MDELKMVALDVKAIPIDCLVRHVKQVVMAADKETVLRTEIDVVVSDYCWLIEMGKTKTYVSGDHPLPCILGEESEETSPVVAKMTQLNPITGEVYYRKADIRKNQMDAWVKASIPELEK